MNDRSRTGFHGGRNSCSLIAMSNLGLRPDKTYFSHKIGMLNEDILKSCRKQTRLRAAYDPPAILPLFLSPTVEQFAKKHPKGLFLVFVKGHVGVIDNGELLNFRDDCNGAAKRVMYAYLVQRKFR